MKLTPFALLATVAILTGCANETRSRNTGDPKVPGTTLAAQVCSNCHGLNGHSVSPNFPNLAGQQADYIVSQLNGFRSHSRLDPAGFEYMWGIARHLSDDQIKSLSEYYAAQTIEPQQTTGKPEDIAAGKLIFESGIGDRSVPACFGCHGDHGQGLGPIPRLAGQHADYVAKQLKVFQRTDERPDGAAMKVVAHGLTQQDIESVAAYVESIR